MNHLSDIISGGFGEFFEQMSESIHSLAEQLSEEELWQNPFGYGNSFGNLLLHLSGNLNHFLGSVISGTDYLRDREKEFQPTNTILKKDLLEQFDVAITTALSVAYNQREEDWGKDKILLGKYGEKNRFETILFTCSHLFHHLGQMIYIVKEIEKQRKV